MSFCAKFDDAPHLYGYADAARWEADVKPIRGRPDCKPLGARHKTHATIRREGEAVICKLYYTDVLTYYPDGRIVVKLDGWATQSTCAFIESVVGLRVGMRHNRVWVSAMGGYYPMHTQGENTFTRAMGVLHFDNPASVTVHKVNRRGANTVRRIYKPFVNYIKNVMRVRDDGFSMQEMGEAFGWVKEGLPKLPDYIRIDARRVSPTEPINELLALATPTDDPDETNANFYKASLWLARSAGQIWGWVCKPTALGMLGVLDDCILLKHRDQCFDEITVEPGVMARDTYVKFF